MAVASCRYLWANVCPTYNIGRCPVCLYTVSSHLATLLSSTPLPPIFSTWASVGSTSRTGVRSPSLKRLFLRKRHGLVVARRGGREEMVRPHAHTLAPRHGIIGIVIAVQHRAPFSRLYINERHRVVDFSTDIVLRRTAEACYPQSAPVDVVFLSVVLMLVPRQIYAIDTVGIVCQPLTFKDIILPRSGLQVVGWRDVKAESVAQAPLPVAFVV